MVELIIGIIVVVLIILLLSKLRDSNEEINDIYPFTDKGDLK